MPNAECRMAREASYGERTPTSIPHSAFRIPHSALGNIPHSALRIPHCVHTADDSLNCNEDGEVTHAVTHTPQPTHPSGLSTGWPRPSSASARSPTGQARAHTPQDIP